jgi:DNA-binding CsgD family transcriptional regulator
LGWHGDIDGARTTAAELLDACGELGFLVQNAYLVVIWAELTAGDATAALRAGEAALRSVTNSAIEKANLIWAAKAALACGQTARAREWADEAIPAISGMFLCLGLAERARIHIAEGDRELAATDVYDGLAIAAPMGAYVCVPDYLECLAEAMQDADGCAHAVRLLGAASSMRTRYELPRLKVYDGQYESVLAFCRNVLGNNRFENSWTEGASLSTEEAIAYAQRGRGQRRRPSTGWASLTPTELDVVRLVAEGIPNKDIATRLFVSPRTVQSHLRHVYNKVGLTSRVQLAREAARQIITPT